MAIFVPLLSLRCLMWQMVRMQHNGCCLQPRVKRFLPVGGACGWARECTVYRELLQLLPARAASVCTSTALERLF